MRALVTDPNDVSGNATVRWGDRDLASTKPNIVNGGDGSSSSYSVTPTGISGQFDEAYGKAVAGYAPFTGDHSKIDQLQSLYGNVGDAFDVSGTVAALDKSRKTNMLTGEAAASDAASKFQESQSPNAQSGTAASLIRARALMPFLNADTEAAGETGKYVDSAKQNALKTGADIASKLADLEQSYTNSLATYNSNKANFGLDYAKGQTSASISASSSSNNALELGLLAQKQGQQSVADYQSRADAERQRQLALMMSRSSAAAPAPASTGFSLRNNLGQIMF